MSENMDETPDRPAEESTTKAVKDKNCPYCHQAFTSSSLGRHLDLYIRDKNPKAPDGVHDVDAIRKTRQNITRRQPKGALARRATSASAGTPASVSRRSPGSVDAESCAARSPLSQRDNSQSGAGAVAGAPSKYPFNKLRWEATGVINNIAAREGGADREVEGDDGPSRGSRSGPSQRSVGRQTLKRQLDARQQVQDAEDRARASELALRELLGSLRAAKQQIDLNSMPFDFDPFSLDFPALTLQCLDPPPTLFASTQHPTPASWSILPPGSGQLEALHAYFQKEFRHWKHACAAATTVVAEELTYPPSSNAGKTDTRAEVLAAEKAAEKMEGHVYDHLAATYSIWNGLAQEQREQLWRLELARGVGRKQKEVGKLKEGQHLLRQENANLKAQIEQLTRLQQPREFKIAPPSTVYIDEKLLKCLIEMGVMKAKDSVGFDIGDRHSDLNTIVSRVIDRWKTVIVSTRSVSYGSQPQLPLNTEDLSPGTSPQEQQPQQRQQPPQHHPSTTTATPHLTSSTSTPTASSLTPRPPPTPAIPNADNADDDDDASSDGDISMSDRDAASSDAEDGDADGDTDVDADADMDDGGHHHPHHQQQPHQGGYTNGQVRGQVQQQQQQQQQRQLHPAMSRQMGRLEVSSSSARVAQQQQQQQQMGGGGGRRGVESGGVVRGQAQQDRMSSWA